MRILLVEYDELFAADVKSGLLVEGYAVDIINEGEKAMRRVEMNFDSYDIIILDMTLPSIEGLAVVQFIRTKGIQVPIMALSDTATTEDKINTLNAGVDDYMTKPFSFPELIARLHALLRRPPQFLSNELIAGNIVLNCQTHTVYVNEKEVSLSLKEFRVLEYLMRNPNQVIPRDRLMDHVWDFAFSSFSNIVDVHINGVRKKLRLSRHGVLETVRGVGYRIKTTFSKVSKRVLRRRHSRKSAIPNN